MHLLQLLPFRYRDDDQNRRFLIRVVEMAGGENQARYLLARKEFHSVFAPKEFEAAFDEHQRIYRLSLRRLELLQQAEDGKLFPSIAERVFEASTGLLRKNNEAAYNLFLSFVRRKHMVEEDAAVREAQRTRYMSQPPKRGGQYRLPLFGQR